MTESRRLQYVLRILKELEDETVVLLRDGVGNQFKGAGEHFDALMEHADSGRTAPSSEFWTWMKSLSAGQYQQEFYLTLAIKAHMFKALQSEIAKGDLVQALRWAVDLIQTPDATWRSWVAAKTLRGKKGRPPEGKWEAIQAEAEAVWREFPSHSKTRVARNLAQKYHLRASTVERRLKKPRR